MKAAPDNGHLRRRALLRGAAAAALLLATLAARAAAWPAVALPPQADSFPVGETLTVGGMPMRLRGFVAPQPPAQLVSWFRASIGQPLVQDQVGGKLVLGRADGEYYVSIQLEVAGSGTRGVLAICHLKGAYDRQRQAQADSERLLARLPAGSQLLSQMKSHDGSRHAAYLVWANAQGVDFNRDHLVRMLRADGYALEPGGERRTTLYFKGSKGQAMAVLHRNAQGRTSVVLNTTTAMEQIR